MDAHDTAASLRYHWPQNVAAEQEVLDVDATYPHA